MDKPIYLPHQQIPVQLQQEVRKCLESWLKQGIICPSKSPYASQVVIVCKKSGKICLCVDFRKLNAISIRDSFPLPRIEEALQAVQAAVLSGLPALTWPKAIYKWPWKKLIFPKLPFVRVLAVCSNLPACHSGLPMPEPHFAG